MKRSQDLLFFWFKEAGLVDYDRIKLICEYLNIKFDLRLEKPIYDLFYPLLYNGVVDFAGNGRYHIAPECCVTKNGGVNILLNSNVVMDISQIWIVGIQIINGSYLHSGKNIYIFNLESILKNLPTLEDCVLSFQKKIAVNIDEFEFSQGVSKKINDSLMWYFIDFNKQMYYEIPHQSSNPDALNLAINYERVCKFWINGTYNYDKEELRLIKDYMPIIIYRTLMIESVLGGVIPFTENGSYVFRNINKRSYVELNRIFCKSIKLTN